MEELNTGADHTNPSDLFNINPIAMSNWLSEQSRSVYKDEIAALEHALSLIQDASEALKKKPYLSIAQLFDQELTPSEFREYQTLGGLEAGDGHEGTSIEQLERRIFLDTMYGRDLNRGDARAYAELKILEISGTISPEQLLTLQGFEERLGEDENNKNQAFKNMLEKALEARGETIDSFKAQQQVQNRVGEITEAILGRIRKK